MVEELFDEIEAKVPLPDMLEYLTDNYDAGGNANPGIGYVLGTLEWMARRKCKRFHALEKGDSTCTKYAYRERAGFWNNVAESLAKAFDEIVKYPVRGREGDPEIPQIWRDLILCTSNHPFRSSRGSRPPWRKEQ